MAREIKFDTPITVTVTVREEVKEDVSSVLVNILDTGDSVVAYTTLPIGEGLNRDFVLWEGENYKAIGQWTDLDVEKRIKEIIGQ